MDTENVILVSLSRQELQSLIKEAVEECLQNTTGCKSETWLTRMEAASYLKISLPTFDKMVKLRHVRIRRTGRKQLFNQQEIDEKILIKNK